MENNQGPEPISVQDLRGLFASRRPDPESFRAGVEKRIAQQRADQDGATDTGKPTGNTTFLRHVAAVLPMDPVLGAKAGSTTIKALYTALALPALVLASVIGSFAASVRSVKRVSRQAVPASGKPVNWRKWRIQPLNDDLLRGGRLMVVVHSGLLLSLLLSFLMGGHTAMDVLTIVLLIAMGAVVLVVRGLASEGLLSRREAARLATHLLLTVFVGCFLPMSTILALPDGHALLGIGWAASAILMSLVACVALGWNWRRGLLALGLAGLMVTGFNTGAVTRSSPALLNRQLAGMNLDPSSLEQWEGAESIFMALESVGSPTPDSSANRARFARAIEEGVDIHPVVWTAAAHMGWIDDVQWARIAESGSDASTMKRLFAPERAMRMTAYYEYRVPMLLASQELSALEREQMAENALAAWPTTGEHGALGDAAMLMRVLERLDRGDLVAGQKEATHDLLVRYWVAPGVPGPFGQVGGFTANPEKFTTSFMDDTWAAIELMARVGVPEEIDLYWLRGYLKKESRSTPLFFELLPSHRAMPRAALLRLEHELGLPSRSWVEAILAERLLIATLLLVALCLLAIRLAPRSTDELAQGAQP